jgi:hypothetical protein
VLVRQRSSLNGSRPCMGCAGMKSRCLEETAATTKGAGWCAAVCEAGVKYE